jgi:hypothetical protein
MDALSSTMGATGERERKREYIIKGTVKVKLSLFLIKPNGHEAI